MNTAEEKPIDLKRLVSESQGAMLLAAREGRSVHIEFGEWAVGHSAEAGMYKVDPMHWHSGFPDPTSEEQYVCKSLNNPLAPIGVGRSPEQAVEMFVFNQSMGQETRLSGDFVLPIK
jgi:hypothetical protein